jgi:hypothetical protein
MFKLFSRGKQTIRVRLTLAELALFETLLADYHEQLCMENGENHDRYDDLAEVEALADKLASL